MAGPLSDLPAGLPDDARGFFVVLDYGSAFLMGAIFFPTLDSLRKARSEVVIHRKARWKGIIPCKAR